MVSGSHIDAAAADVKAGIGFDPLGADCCRVAGGSDCNIAAADAQRSFRRNTVARGGNGDGAAADLDKALFRLICHSGLYSVIAGSNGQVSPCDAHRFGAADTVIGGQDRDGAAHDVQIVLAGDTVIDITAYLQRPLTLDIQVVLGINGGAAGRWVRLGHILLCAGSDFIGAAGSKDNIHVLGLDYIDGRIVKAGNVHAVQRQGHVAGIFTGVDDDAAVVQRSGDRVFTGGGDGHGAAVYGDAAACVFGAVAV